MKPNRRNSVRSFYKPTLEALESRVYASGSPVNIVVNTILDQVDPVGSSTISLRDAVKVADASTGPVTIGFNSKIFAAAQTIKLSTSILELSNTKQPINFVGPVAGVTINAVNANGGFQIDTAVVANLSGITVTQCASPAIVNNGILSLVNSTLSNNTGRAEQ